MGGGDIKLIAMLGLSSGWRGTRDDFLAVLRAGISLA
jgi:Flp pilus assembly protein protease CpaA